MTEPDRAPLLQLKAVSHSYPEPSRGILEVLESADLEIRAGERVAILGPSGSGKSTLLSIMAGLQRPSKGEVFWSGQSLAHLTEAGLSRLRPEKIALVFQQFLLIPHLTALENASLPLELRGLSRDQARETARRKLEELGLGARLDHFPRMLSGGECQRVAIARAMVAGPELLLADEPTGNLDPATASQIFELLLSLPRQSAGRPCALVLVTHNEELASRCDRRVRLSDRHLGVEKA